MQVYGCCARIWPTHATQEPDGGAIVMQPATVWMRRTDPSFVAVVLVTSALKLLRVHETLRLTRAMQAGVADHVRSLDEVVALLDAASNKAA